MLREMSRAWDRIVRSHASRHLDECRDTLVGVVWGELPVEKLDTVISDLEPVLRHQSDGLRDIRRSKLPVTELNPIIDDIERVIDRLAPSLHWDRDKT